MRPTALGKPLHAMTAQTRPAGASPPLVCLSPRVCVCARVWVGECAWVSSPPPPLLLQPPLKSSSRLQAAGLAQLPRCRREDLKQWEVIELGDICVGRKGKNRGGGVKCMLTILGSFSSWAAGCLRFPAFSRLLPPLPFIQWTCHLFPSRAAPHRCFL